MRCMACGEEMRLVQAVPAEAMTVAGFEHHLFKCRGCNDTEQRLVFIRPGGEALRPTKNQEAQRDLPSVTLQPDAEVASEESDAPQLASNTPSPGTVPVVPETSATSVAPAPQTRSDPKAPTSASHRSVETHRERLSALCARIGLQVAIALSLRKSRLPTLRREA